MCENGVNTAQMKMTIDMVDDALALSQQWLEQLHQLADKGHSHESSAELAQASVLLGEAREKLVTAAEKLDEHTHDHVHVELV